MWYLVKSSDGSKYPLLCEKNIVIGRKDADIVIAGDSSVSRKHGILRITHPQGNLKNPDAVPTITVTDSSKFGTFVTHPGSEKIKVNKTAVLNSGDIVQFGAQHSMYKLQYDPFVVTSSMLGNDVKQRLKVILLQIGGHMVDHWHAHVTHMVVDKIKLSIKVTQALVYGRCIVKPDYVWKISELVLAGNCTNLPSPEEYLPELGEPNLSAEFCSFNVNRQRRTVFKGHTFVYLSKKQLKRLEQTILGGGGKNVLVNDPIVNDVFLSNPTTAVLNCDMNDDSIIPNNAQYEHIQNILLTHGQRLIQEHEVGLAVLYCDSAVYCNPSFDLNSQNTFTQRPMTDTEAEPSVSAPSHSKESKSEKNNNKRQRDDDENERVTSERIFPISPEDNLSSKKAKMDVRENIDAEEPQNNIRSDDIPDSCLDDDNLWSQNFDSSSFQPNKSIHNKEMVVKASINPRNDPKEMQTPTKNQTATSKSERQDCLSTIINEHTKDYCPVTTSSKTHEENIQTKNSVQLTGLNQKNNHVEVIVKRELNSSINIPLNLDQKASDEYDPLLPKNLAVTDIVSLIVKRNYVMQDEYAASNKVKNFKRFKKVWPTYMANHITQNDTESSHKFLPLIIGGSDFFVNEERSNKPNDIAEWFGCDSQNPGPFGNISRHRK